MEDSPDSPLSSAAGTEEYNEYNDLGAATQLPASKRRRTGTAVWDRQTPMSSIQGDVFQGHIVPGSPAVSISSDSSADLPDSPSQLLLIGGGYEDDYSGLGRDQVTICQWDGCDAGDLGHMDALVKHIHDEHIGTRQKKYLCEWMDCPRKGQTHASGYALRAHMRSHTKEKPFYCTLPECDRSFTRSDALTKHIRTVHETEALRPFELAKVQNGSGAGPSSTASAGTNKPQRLKLKLTQHGDSNDQNKNNNGNGTIQPPPPPKESPTILFPTLDADLGFDDYELSLPPEHLYRLLRRQLYWARQENDELRHNWEVIEPLRKQCWREKEAIFTDFERLENKAENNEDAFYTRLRKKKEADVRANGQDRMLKGDINGRVERDEDGKPGWGQP